MKNLIEKLANVLDVCDITLVIAKDGENGTLQVLPKAKTGSIEFPSLNFAGKFTEFDDKLTDLIAEKLNKSLPVVSNIVSFDKNLSDMQEKKKEELKKETAKPTPKASKHTIKPAVQKAEEKEEKEEDEDEEGYNETPTGPNEIAPVETSAPEVQQNKLF